MKILHVITSLKTGGAEKLMVDLLPRLKAKGHEVDLLLFDGTETPFRRQAEAAGIRVMHTRIGGSVYNPINFIKLIPYLKKYDIVHTHNTAPQLFAAFSKLLICCELVTTEHSTSTRRRKYKLLRILDKWMYRRYNQIICISKPSEDSLRNYIGNVYPILTIQNGVNLQSIVNAKPANLNLGDCKKITMVAGFRYEKDQPTVIKALSYLPEYFHLILVGDGSRRGEFEELIRNEGLTSRVHLLGIRSDVPSVLKSSDYIVMSSHREGLSLSNVEGMSVGKPFLAADVEGLREVTQGAGILFPHQDPKALASAILKLDSDATLYNNIAQQCLERANQFDISKMVDGYDTIYKKLINQHK
jgi:glycosyltransferase involved in cell wall biosynthesis